MPTIGEWIHNKLETAGNKGVVSADLFTELRTTHDVIDVTYKGGTYNSFARLFFWFKQLKYVEKTGVTEVSHQRGEITNGEYTIGENPLKAPRTYYRLTDEGKASPIKNWYNPLATVHPDWAPSGEKRQKQKKRWREEKKERTRPRGRPRVGVPEGALPTALPEAPKPKAALPPMEAPSIELEAIQTRASKLCEVMRTLKEHPETIGDIKSELHDICEATIIMVVPKNLRKKVNDMYYAALSASDTIETIKTSLAMIADQTVMEARKRDKEKFIDRWANDFCKEAESFAAILKLPPDVAKDTDLINGMLEKWRKKPIKPNIRSLETEFESLKENLKVTDISKVEEAIKNYREVKTEVAWEDVISAVENLEPGDLSKVVPPTKIPEVVLPTALPEAPPPEIVIPKPKAALPPVVALSTELEAIQARASKLCEVMRALKEHPETVEYIEEELHGIYNAAAGMVMPKNLHDMHDATFTAYDTIETVKKSLATIANQIVIEARKRDREKFIDRWANDFCKAIPKKLPPIIAKDIDLINDILIEWKGKPGKPNIKLLGALETELGNLEATDICNY